MPNHRRQDRELDALYATLPKLDCRGYCHDSCGPIDLSKRERARIVERARKPIPVAEPSTAGAAPDLIAAMEAAVQARTPKAKAKKPAAKKEKVA